MTAEILVSSTENSETRGSFHALKVSEMLKQLEMQSGWKVFEMIKSIIDKQADSFSVSKDNPNSFLFIRGNHGGISVSFQKETKEVKVSIPREDINSLYPSD